LEYFHSFKRLEIDFFHVGYASQFSGAGLSASEKLLSSVVGPYENDFLDYWSCIFEYVGSGMCQHLPIWKFIGLSC
jgi:hypothetical protein